MIQIILELYVKPKNMKFLLESFHELELGTKFSYTIPKTIVKDKIIKQNFIWILKNALWK